MPTSLRWLSKYSGSEKLGVPLKCKGRLDFSCGIWADVKEGSWTAYAVLLCTEYQREDASNIF